MVIPPPLPANLLAILMNDRASPPDPRLPNADGRIDHGQRNDTLVSLAGTMRHRDFPEQAIAAALEITNRLRCNPPLPPREVDGIVDSIMRYRVSEHAASDLEIAADLQESDTSLRVVGGRPEQLVWYTAADIAAAEPERPEWVVEPYVASGTITELAGKIKVGKTTMLGSLVAATLTRTPFLGHPTRYGPVIWLTEERPPSIRSGLARSGLLAHEDLYVSTYGDARDFRWSDVVTAVLEQAKAINAALVVVDTIPTWAAIPGDGENAAGPALDAMREVSRLADAGLAVIVVRHGRKSGGEIGDSARGSSAWGGAADILLVLKQGMGQGHPNRRVLEAVGRFDDIPPKLVIELREGRYVALGTKTAVEAEGVREAVLELLPDNPEDALLEKEILARLAGEGRGSRATWLRARDGLIKDGQIMRREGLGKTGVAYGYWRRVPHADDAARTENDVLI